MPKIDKLTTHTRKRRPGDRMTEQERTIAQRKFIDALGRTANITAACMHAGISRSIVYIWQEHYPDFGAEFREANLRASDVLVGEAWHRATTGEVEYVVSAGKLVYGPDGKPLTTRKKSDALLTLLLKARMPEYREKQQIDLTTTTTQDTQELHMVITQALASYPEAKIAVAEALMAVEKARTRDK